MRFFLFFFLFWCGKVWKVYDCELSEFAVVMVFGWLVCWLVCWLVGWLVEVCRHQHSIFAVGKKHHDERRIIQREMTSTWHFFAIAKQEIVEKKHSKMHKQRNVRQQKEEKTSHFSSFDWNMWKSIEEKMRTESKMHLSENIFFQPPPQRTHENVAFLLVFTLL